MRSFLGFGQSPYIGQPGSQAIKLAGIATVCVPLLFQWLSYGAATVRPNVNVYVDLDVQACKALDQIRSIYIDNLGSNIPVYVYFPDSNYTVVAQPNSEGWYPAFTNQKKIWVIGEGFLDGSIPQTFIIISNLYIPPSVNVEIPQQVTLWKASPVITRGNSIYNSSFGIPALGDQLTAGVLDATGFNAQRLWNTPYAGGFLFIQQILCTLFNAFGTHVAPQGGQFVIESTGAAGALIAPQFSAPIDTSPVSNQILIDLKGMNIKLDATQTWQARIITPVISGNVQIFTSFTQSPN